MESASIISGFIHFQKGWMRINYYDTKVEKKLLAVEIVLFNYYSMYSYQTCIEKPCKVVLSISHIRNCGLQKLLDKLKFFPLQAPQRKTVCTATC